MGKKSLPPGFRFHPTDVELVKYYLKRKVLGKKLHFDAVAEVEIYKFAPWDLPDKSCLQTGDLKWYFFCPREKKYASGTRMNRGTDLGYWKTTGKDRSVRYGDEVVGMIKTLVFHRGKAPKGERTDWVMHEYRLDDKGLDLRGVAQDAYVLCSIFKKDGLGPKNGAQYGAPFKEEDWDDDNDDDEVKEVNGSNFVSCIGKSAPVPVNQSSSIATSSHVTESTCRESTVLCPFEVPSISNTDAAVSVSYFASEEPPQVATENDDDIDALLDNFSEEFPFTLSDYMNEVDNINHSGNNAVNPSSDGIDIYDSLGDLGNLTGFGENVSGYIRPTWDQMLGGDGQYLELMDLDTPLDCYTEGDGYEQVQTGCLYANDKAAI